MSHVNTRLVSACVLAVSVTIGVTSWSISGSGASSARCRTTTVEQGHCIASAKSTARKGTEDASRLRALSSHFNSLSTNLRGATTREADLATQRILLMSDVVHVARATKTSVDLQAALAGNATAEQLAALRRAIARTATNTQVTTDLKAALAGTASAAQIVTLQSELPTSAQFTTCLLYTSRCV